MDSYDNEITSKEMLYALILEHGNNPAKFSGVNNIVITKLAEGYAEGELTITEQSMNPLGIVHGGCLATLADTVAGAAVATHGQNSMTLNYAMNFLSPATGTKIKCVATPQRVGKNICVYNILLTDDNGQTVASGNFTFVLIPRNRMKSEKPVQKDSRA